MANLFSKMAQGMWPTIEAAPSGADTPIEGMFLNGWPGGWRADIPDTQLDPTQLSDLLNVDFDRNGIIKKRGGYIEITDSTVTNLTVPDHLISIRMITSTGLFPNYSQQLLWFNENDGELFTQSFGNIMKEYNTAASGIDFVDSKYGMGPAVPSAVNIFRVFPIVAIPFEDDVYITTLRYNATKTTTTYQDTTATERDASGQSKPLKYDVAASTFTRLATNQLVGGTAGIPRGRVGLSKYSRLFIGNVHGDTFRYPSRLYFSYINAAGVITPETWRADDYIDVGGDDGDEITAVTSFGEMIVIFKNTSVWGLDGVGPSDFALHSLEQNLGTEATNCVVQHAGLLYFFDYRSGIWAYDGATFNMISEPINGELLANINKYAAFKASSWIHDNKVYFSFPIGAGGTTPADYNSVTYIWDILNNTWTKYSFGAVDGIEYYTDYSFTAGQVPSTTNLYVVAPNHVEGIFKTETGYKDITAAIAAHFTTGWLNVGDIDDRTRLRRLMTVFESTAAGNSVTIQVYRDFNNTVWLTVTADPTGQTVYDFHDSVTDVGFFSWIKLKFSNAVVDEDMRVRGVGMSVSSKRKPRGQVHGGNYVA